MHIRFNIRYLSLISGMAGVFIVACGGSAPSAAPTVAATSVPPTTVVVAVTPAPPTSTAVPPTSTSAPAALERVESEPAVVVFRVTDRSIEAPEFIPAGLTTIRLQNDGSVRHSLVVFDIDEGHTVDDVARELQGQFWPESWAPAIGEVSAEAGESNEWTVRLVKGLYAATDWSVGSDQIPHFAKGAFTGFEVSAAVEPDAAWDPDAIQVELGDFWFTGISDLPAGRNTFRFVNVSKEQDHMIIFVPLDADQTAQGMFGDYVYERTGGTLEFEPAAEIGWIGPRQEVEYSVDLAPGSYAVVCLLPDGHPGTPHSNLGMLGQITVSG